jgi:hypothetical protein
MSALGMPIKAVAISYCQRLLKEGIIKEWGWYNER